MPDELIEEIVKYISIKEILTKLCYVNKRWNKISNASVLWRDVILNESDITRLEEKHFEKIMRHSHGFVFFSLRHIKIEGPSVRITETLEKNLAMASNLVYLDLSWQDVSSVDFLLNGITQHNIETLILDNCKNIEFKHLFNAILKLQNLSYLSLNNIYLLAQDAVAITKHTPLVFYLGFSGIDLNMSDVNSSLENTNRLIFLEMSSFDHNRESFRDLCNQYDVSVTFHQK